MTDPAPTLDPARVDLSALATALEQGDWSAAYLDPVTGAIRPAADSGVPAGWIAVGGEQDTRAAFADMADFAASVTDPVLRERLDAALVGKGAFRRFKDVVRRDGHRTTGPAWAEFRDRRAQLRALDWLVAEDLVAVHDAHRHAAALVERTAPAGAAGAARLILINGMPGVGKSTLAARYAAQRPEVLVVEQDLLAESLADDPRGPAEAARALALVTAGAHLDTGHDVVVPQLVARVDQVARYEKVARAAGAGFVHVVLDAKVPAHRVPVAAQRHLRAYRAGLAAVRDDASVHPVTSHDDDVDRTLAALEALVGDAR